MYQTSPTTKNVPEMESFSLTPHHHQLQVIFHTGSGTLIIFHYILLLTYFKDIRKTDKHTYLLHGVVRGYLMHYNAHLSKLSM